MVYTKLVRAYEVDSKFNPLYKINSQAGQTLINLQVATSKQKGSC
jgi:hypothetical protein